jgi:predicted HD superfamily hydrolase involved in NAD metabolism
MASHYFDSLQSSGNPGKDVAQFLAEAGKIETLAHIRQVVGQARILAAKFGTDMAPDMKRAAVAAWCHDMAAVVPRADILEVADEWAVPLTDDDRAIPAVVHGPLAAEVARVKLGVDDEEVLDAIRYHSTLRAGAGFFEKVVFVADKAALDPTAPRSDFLSALSAAMADGLDAMAFAYLDWVIQHEDALGWRIHPDLRAAHAELALQVRQDEAAAEAAARTE